MCSSHKGSACARGLGTPTSHRPALQVCQVLWGQEQRGFLLVLCLSSFFNQHVPKTS